MKILLILSMMCSLTTGVGGERQSSDKADCSKNAQEKADMIDSLLLNELRSFIADDFWGNLGDVIGVSFFEDSGMCYVALVTDLAYFSDKMRGYAILGDKLIAFYFKDDTCYQGLIHVDKLLQGKPEGYYDIKTLVVDMGMRYDPFCKVFRYDKENHCLELTYHGDNYIYDR